MQDFERASIYQRWWQGGTTYTSYWKDSSDIRLIDKQWFVELENWSK